MHSNNMFSSLLFSAQDKGSCCRMTGLYSSVSGIATLCSNSSGTQHALLASSFFSSLKYHIDTSPIAESAFFNVCSACFSGILCQKQSPELTWLCQNPKILKPSYLYSRLRCNIYLTVLSFGFSQIIHTSQRWLCRH